MCASFLRHEIVAAGLRRRTFFAPGKLNLMKLPAAAALIALGLASCARVVPAPSLPPPPPVPAPAPPAPPTPVPPPAGNALIAGVRAGPAVSQLGLADAQSRRAPLAFLTSCPAIVARTDASGLTRPEDWRALCGLARERGSPPASFFSRPLRRRRDRRRRRFRHRLLRTGDRRLPHSPAGLRDAGLPRPARSAGAQPADRRALQRPSE